MVLVGMDASKVYLAELPGGGGNSSDFVVGSSWFLVQTKPVGSSGLVGGLT